MDYSCLADDDCEIKNVGNCCGYYPECVNTGFQPNPDWCDGLGLASVCGFPSINACICEEGRCQGVLQDVAAKLPPPPPYPPPPPMGAGCIAGYWPLFTAKPASDAASPGGGGSHTHRFGGTTYYMPNGFPGAQHEGSCPSFAVPFPSSPPSGSPPQCIQCTDELNNYMESNGLVCDQYPYAYSNLCKHNDNWAKKKFCQRSCFANGVGYDGDVCCPPPASTPACTECTDERNKYMVDNDVACDQYPYAYSNLCKHNDNWAKQKFCQKSCFANGAGYAGEVCCATPPPTCTECTDDRNAYMQSNDLVCDRYPYAYDKLCKHNEHWAKQKFCQRSCYANGAGYGEVCCAAAPLSPSPPSLSSPPPPRSKPSPPPPGAPSPPPSSAPSPLPSTSPSPPPRCGTETCTAAVQMALAGDYTCGQRMSWLEREMGYTEPEACTKVAVVEYPEECGGCAPPTGDVGSEVVPAPPPSPPASAPGRLVTCSGGQVWNPCGSACSATCDEPEPLCIAVCVPRCECPAPLLQGGSGKCVSRQQC